HNGPSASHLTLKSTFGCNSTSIDVSKRSPPPNVFTRPPACTVKKLWRLVTSTIENCGNSFAADPPNGLWLAKSGMAVGPNRAQNDAPPTQQQTPRRCPAHCPCDLDTGRAIWRTMLCRYHLRNTLWSRIGLKLFSERAELVSVLQRSTYS